MACRTSTAPCAAPGCAEVVGAIFSRTEPEFACFCPGHRKRARQALQERGGGPGVARAIAEAILSTPPAPPAARCQWQGCVRARAADAAADPSLDPYCSGHRGAVKKRARCGAATPGIERWLEPDLEAGGQGT